MARDERSAGLVPAPVPLGGLTEIRVHGVGGTGPDTLLGDPAPTRVAGDRVAGFYRTTDAGGRHREAYSWGGLTSRSRMRALWALLLPSMLANMAGWMARRWVTAGEEEADRPATLWIFRWFARLTALALTLTSAAMVTYLALDVLAYQWGRTEPVPVPAAGASTDGWQADLASWWAQAIATWTAADRPGNRLVLGALAAVLVALGFALLARQTRSSYESVVPPTPISAEPGARDVTATVGRPRPSLRSAAALDGGLRNADFWAGLEWHTFLSRLHLTACLGVVALLLGWSSAALGAGSSMASFGQVAAVAAGGGILLVMGLLAFDDAEHDLARVALALTTCALLLAGISAALVPAGPGPDGMLPGSRSALNLVWGASLVLLVPLALQQSGAWLYRLWQAGRLRRQGERLPRLTIFPWAGPFVMNTAAVVVANTVLLSAIVYVAGLVGTVEWGFGPDAGARGAPGTIYVPMAIGSLASILSLGLIVLVVLFAAVFLLVLGRRRRANARRVEADLREQYAAAHVPDVDADPPARSEAGWWRSAFDPPLFGPPDRRPGRPTPWVHKVTAMRFLGDHSRSVAALLIALTVLAVVGLFLFLNEVLRLHHDPPMLFVGLGTKVAVAFPPLYVLVLTLAWRNERWRRVLGSLFDVGTFFPRAFHPFAPPAYAERAVPELTRRIWRLHDNGGRVVVTAHSQGSVIAAAAVGRTSGRADAEPAIGVVTFGSPLGKLYRWAFPALFSDGFLAGIARGRPGIGPVLWRNVYYATDYIGGPVRTGTSIIPDGVDLELVDPPTHRYVVDQPLPRVLSHTGYWYDEALWTQVDAMCAAIGAPPPDAASAHPWDTVAPDPDLPGRYR
ncbi:hypothetical protein [Cellulomonas fengjieae]|uniref:Integral membrane protein n=1 Tax=Cellulomonas fengjieae TaxID=2819978 RepID=A0ABS3SET0_9CELL|nr:hypothetical protein [Cellulomonas fengjieae]MBO3084255.1 hypothetical protein [Cellulomonas fengjieae]QVI64506.1 hypothetical protein KG102_09875 [Cellulomonas fengjieae]